MGVFDDEAVIDPNLATGERLTRERFRELFAQRIVAGQDMWDREDDRPASGVNNPFDPEKRDLKFEWNPFAFLDRSFLDKLEYGDEGFGAVIDYIYDNLPPAYRTKGFLDRADIRNVLREVLRLGDAGTLNIDAETRQAFEEQIVGDTNVMRRWIRDNAEIPLLAEGYSPQDVDRVIEAMATGDLLQPNNIYDVTQADADQYVADAKNWFNDQDTVPTTRAVQATPTATSYAQTQMDIGYLSGDDLRQAFYETGDYGAFVQFIQAQELAWEEEYGDLKPDEIVNNPNLVVPDRAKFAVWDDQPSPNYNFKDNYTWSEALRLPFELPDKLIADLSKKWELSGLYDRYNIAPPVVTGSAADPSFQIVWRRVLAESFMTDTPMYTFADNALQSRIARVDGLISRFDATNVDQQIDGLFYNILGRRGTASEIANMRNSIALLDQDITEAELETGIESELASLESQGLTGALQTQIASRLRQRFGPEAQRQQVFASSQAFGKFGPRQDVDEPFQPAATITGDTGLGRFED